MIERWCLFALFFAPLYGEQLRYGINLPSGLSLGEVQIRSEPSGDRVSAEFTVEAAFAGFSILDRFRSVATRELCSLEFEKDSVHGKRKAKEKTTFDGVRGIAVRETAGGGGKTEMQIPACPRDALAFLSFVRQELSKGRVPPAQSLYFGATYQVRLQYSGTQNVRVGDESLETDKIVGSVRGAASDITFEIYFARDAVRTPVMVKLPLALGLLSMEIVR